MLVLFRNNVLMILNDVILFQRYLEWMQKNLAKNARESADLGWLFNGQALVFNLFSNGDLLKITSHIFYCCEFCII